MFKLILRALNITPTNPRTLAVCASSILLAACASNNSYDINAHNGSHIPTRPDSSYNTYSSKDVWQRVRDNFGMPDLINDEVGRKEDYYATRADYVNRMASRSGDFLPLIMNEVERRRMPSEIALLPFVESAFVTNASSPVKASGLWQFMPATGRDFSLEQNRFADQRNDVVASTDAALTFLQRLHDQFGDWHLALAAYNWGPGNVTKAVRRAQAAGLQGTYEDIRMPLETRQYVPKLQAIKNIVANPSRFGIALPDVSKESRHEVVTITRDIDVTKAAELSGLDYDTFKRINPSFKKSVIVAALGSRILVPSERAEAVRDALNDRSKTLATLTTYSAYNTESLTDIASQFNTNEDNLRSINGIPSYHNYVKAGSTLLVPRTTNKASQDIPYQALTAGLTTTSGGIGFGTDMTIDAPTYIANTDETTRQERSGIASISNASALFASSAPSNSGPGLALTNSSNDELSHLINSARSTKDPVSAPGAFIANSPTRNITPPAEATSPVIPTFTPFVATAPTTPAPVPTTFVAAPEVKPIEVNVAAATPIVIPTAAPTAATPTSTAQVAPAAPIVATVVEPVNDALTPLNPSIFKAIEKETIAANEASALSPAPEKAKAVVAAIKPVTKPITAVASNIKEGKVVKVNYTPPVQTPIQAPIAKTTSKPATTAAVKPQTAPQTKPAAKAEVKTSAKPAKPAATPAPAVKTEAKNAAKVVVKADKPKAPAPAVKGKPVATISKPVEKAAAQKPTVKVESKPAAKAAVKASAKEVIAKAPAKTNSAPAKAVTKAVEKTAAKPAAKAVEAADKKLKVIKKK